MRSLLRVGLMALVLPAAVLGAPKARPDFRWSALERIAIQDRGRVKPLQTFAEESVLFVTGSRSWQGMSATEVLFGWLIAYEQEWQDHAFIRVDYQPLKQSIGLATDRKHFTPEELGENPEFQKIISEVIRKERREEPLTTLEEKAREVQNKRSLVESVVIGESVAILPNPQGLSAPWAPLARLADRMDLPYSPEQVQKLSDQVRGLLTSFQGGDARLWNDTVSEFVLFLRESLSGGHYPSAKVLNREIHYNELRPFRVSWILYALSCVVLGLFLVSRKRWFQYAGLALLFGGWGMNTYGMVIRSLVAERPPVTNMYESVIWVTWGCVLFALLVWARYRNATVLLASTVFSVVGLVLADNLPSILDPGIHPLEPVLRSNFWLTVHVLTITLSYAAFAVSLCVGNVVLGYHLFAPTRTEKAQEYSLYMYRAVQIGVVLLAAGTILGGVWADYSWGRFWGWDPKEVWALVALLLYLAVLHGRFTGWLRGFGFAAATVVSFLGVLMAWYGVNFVLGAGLHSYGFGSGGMGWVSLFVAAQLGYIGAALYRHRKVAGEQKLDQGIFPRGGGVR